jgi:hypothetical protein
VFTVLNVKGYTGRFIVVAEVAYALCLLYGYVLPPAARVLHAQLFELLVGFSWSVGGVILGAITIAVMSALLGAVGAWLHNGSQEQGAAVARR